MPAYIKNGQVVEKRPALNVAYQWIQEIYLALSLFLWSLFNPNQQHRLAPNRSLREARDKQREEEQANSRGGPGGAQAGRGSGAGGGGGAATRRRGGQMTLGDLSGGPVVAGMQGGCAGGSCG